MGSLVNMWNPLGRTVINMCIHQISKNPLGTSKLRCWSTFLRSLSNFCDLVFFTCTASSCIDCVFGNVFLNPSFLEAWTSRPSCGNKNGIYHTVVASRHHMIQSKFKTLNFHIFYLHIPLLQSLSLLHFTPNPFFELLF